MNDCIEHCKTSQWGIIITDIIMVGGLCKKVVPLDSRKSMKPWNHKSLEK